MNRKELKEFLDEKFVEYNQPQFIPPDPISIPHRYSRKEDIEISGLLTAIISWGRRDLIIRSAGKMMELMEEQPYEFVVHAGESDLERMRGFVYRTFQGDDCWFAIRGLRKIYREGGGLEKIMQISPEDTSTLNAVMNLRKAVSEVEGFPHRTFKHFANPEKGSSAKRINMFLRWMCRTDQGGVDFGIWNSPQPHQLICPLDVHTGNVARKLGLLTRKQNDWKAALELTQNLRELNPSDPVRYDFSLFGLGVFEGF